MSKEESDGNPAKKKDRTKRMLKCPNYTGWAFRAWYMDLGGGTFPNERTR